MRMLLAKGAEAHLYVEEWQGMRVLAKHRVRKPYRIPELDREVRRFRTVHEAEMLHRAKLAGVPTPLVYLVDLDGYTIYMEYVEGRRLREAVEGMDVDERRRVFELVGSLVGRLHANGIIHGDVTTSNMILRPDGTLFFVDFGLGEVSSDVERMGVDVHLFEEMLVSTHYRYVEELLDAFLRGYRSAVGSETFKQVMEKVEEIRRRGRYVSERRARKVRNLQQGEVQGGP